MALAIIIGGHVALLVLLAAHREPAPRGSAEERMTLVSIDLPGSQARAAPATRGLAPRLRLAAPTTIAPLPEAPASDSTAISPGIDWYARGADAAQRATQESATRDFSVPKREPAPREKKPFGWDQTHTERVHALEGGGIGIHLSDNCDLIIAPLPLAGCAFGKRKARGDLFDEMKAPVEPGDWKDR